MNTGKRFDVEEILALLIIRSSYDSSLFLFSEEDNWLDVFKGILKRRIINAEVISSEDVDFFVIIFVDKYKEKILNFIRERNFILNRVR